VSMHLATKRPFFATNLHLCRVSFLCRKHYLTSICLMRACRRQLRRLSGSNWRKSCALICMIVRHSSENRYVPWHEHQRVISVSVPLHRSSLRHTSWSTYR
jgi:hypothetical protein